MAAGFSVKDALNKNSKAGIDETPKARFRTKDISIFKMYRNDMNFYKVEDIEELAGDILMYGLKQNLELIYAPCEKGEFRIVAGERRWEALKHLVAKGYKEFEIATSKLTTPQDDDEEQVEIIIANAYRVKGITDMIEEEKRLKESLERMRAAGKKIKGYDLQSGRLRDVIASMLHMSKTKVAQIEAVNNNLIPEWKEELKLERLTFSAAYELSGMSADEQREALGKFIECGELTHKDIKDMKEAKAASAAMEQVERQMKFEDVQVQEEDATGQQESESGEEESAEVAGFGGMNPPSVAGEEYQTPHPESITSICYSCTEYETCNVKTGTCTKCDQYNDRAEAHKTDEQRYSEEQDAIDRETERKMRERAELLKLPKAPATEEKKKYIRVSEEMFKRIVAGKQHYMIAKNDEYKVAQEITLGEFAEGRATGRTLEMKISYMDDDETSTALEKGYCVMNLVEVYRFCGQCEHFDIENASPDGMSHCDAEGSAVAYAENSACCNFAKRKEKKTGGTE